jgi:hypothetical protein
MSKHIIELNGKRYDALTGRLLTSDTAAGATPAPLHSLNAASAPALPHHAATPSRSATHRKPAARPLQPSKTLMRRAVSKPTTKSSPAIKRTAPLPNKVTIGALSPKLSVNAVDPGRARRAQHVQRSQHVDHFIANAPKLTTIVKPLAPVAAPRSTAHPRLDIEPARRPVHATAAHARPVATKSATHTGNKRTNELFDRAIANAKSHEQAKVKPARRKKVGRLLNAMAGVAAFLVIGGFVGYVNRASLQLELASARAGFQANLPEYQPGGFARQAAVAQGREVKISFVSPNNSDRFVLTQQASDWDSQTLFDEISALASTNYQTLQSGGRTIYVYDSGKAAWVNGGVLYRVDGNTQLDTTQISQLAASL